MRKLFIALFFVGNICGSAFAQSSILFFRSEFDTRPVHTVKALSLKGKVKTCHEKRISDYNGFPIRNRLYSFDKEGKLMLIIDSLPDGTGRKLSLLYDKLGRLTDRNETDFHGKIFSKTRYRYENGKITSRGLRYHSNSYNSDDTSSIVLSEYDNNYNILVTKEYNSKGKLYHSESFGYQRGNLAEIIIRNPNEDKTEQLKAILKYSPDGSWLMEEQWSNFGDENSMYKKTFTHLTMEDNLFVQVETFYPDGKLYSLRKQIFTNKDTNGNWLKLTGTDKYGNVDYVLERKIEYYQ